MASIVEVPCKGDEGRGQQTKEKDSSRNILDETEGLQEENRSDQGQNKACREDIAAQKPEVKPAKGKQRLGDKGS